MTFAIARAWKVGQWCWHLGSPDYWLHDSVQHTLEAVKARAADLRANGWRGNVEAMPFFCIVDGDTVHEVKSSPLNARGEWVQEWERVVMVDE
jgi:hypothetical protein